MIARFLGLKVFPYIFAGLLALQAATGLALWHYQGLASARADAIDALQDRLKDVIQDYNREVDKVAQRDVLIDKQNAAVKAIQEARQRDRLEYEKRFAAADARADQLDASATELLNLQSRAADEIGQCREARDLLERELMTTIATDGQRIAADGRLTFNGRIASEDETKLHTLSDGSVVGVAGDPDGTRDLLRALEKNEDHSFSDMTALRLFPSGAIALYAGEAGAPTFLSPPQAIGSGGPFAIGALEAGASPRQAVKIAAKLDPGTGPIVTARKVA